VDSARPLRISNQRKSQVRKEEGNREYWLPFLYCGDNISQVLLFTKRRQVAAKSLTRVILIKRILTFSVLASAVCVLSAADANGQAPGTNAAVVEINGMKITLAEFEHERPAALFQARNAYYEAERKALEEYANDVVLKRQAQKEKLTTAQLLDLHVNSKIAADPSEDALRLYYEGVDTTETFEEARPKIIAHIREKRIAAIKKTYLQSLHDQANIAILLEAPRTPISLANTPVRGAGASVTLVEYADYECPYCQQMQGELDKLEAEYKGRLAFAYKDMPLPMHAHARKASEAAQCAGRQNKYWEFHDEMLRSKQLDVPQLKADAVKFGLDTKAFDSCLDGGQQSAAIQSNLDEAQRLGLTGTPSFFLNGRFISGIMKYEQLRQLVEEELKKPATPEQRASAK
jgi:protein-disulfide isomerase